MNILGISCFFHDAAVALVRDGHIPMVVVLLAFGLLLALVQGSALAPFIYTLF